MRIAVTGGTGFVGRYIVRHLAETGHVLQCWHRPESDRRGLEQHSNSIRWIQGDLDDSTSMEVLVAGCDAVVHAALWRPGRGFRGAEGDLIQFVDRNVLGTLRLVEAARRAEAARFVFISTCAVHEKILSDRPLDETHPTWAASHYGAHKAAIEQFVYSFGLGDGYPICALRPTGVYGVAHPSQESKWFELIQSVVQGKEVTCTRGGKEVHAADVARAVGLLLKASPDQIVGQAFNCYDRYISDWEVAHLAHSISGSKAIIHGRKTSPKNEIITAKFRSLGMEFGGEAILEATVRELVSVAQHQ